MVLKPVPLHYLEPIIKIEHIKQTYHHMLNVMSIYNADVASFLYSIKMLNNYQWLLFLNPYILRITPFCFVGGSDLIYVICIALHFLMTGAISEAGTAFLWIATGFTPDVLAFVSDQCFVCPMFVFSSFLKICFVSPYIYGYFFNNYKHPPQTQCVMFSVLQVLYEHS